MPVDIPANLPAQKTLLEENVFLMTRERAGGQDIRPLRIAVLNLMPTKIVTETQILRLLGNTPLQIEVTFLRMESHEAKNTATDHLDLFYKTFSEVEGEKFDGLIITGAPVETMEFEEVDYWEELRHLMEWSLTNVFSTLHICWGAQAGLYYHFGVPKYPLGEKKFGVFEHEILAPGERIVWGFDDSFYAPHSRHTGIKSDDVAKVSELKLVATSREAGPYLLVSANNRQIFVTGHPEYDRATLKAEYDRDVERGLKIGPPSNYYEGDNPTRPPVVAWRAHAQLLYANWLNYYVYQVTPFDINRIPETDTPFGRT
ncbi:MAG TPA: homoserine O-succinyltransferase [Spirochaetia bacterium]|nr:homoserine O-succinyltransferase [Spirochaetia bacterium]